MSDFRYASMPFYPGPVSVHPAAARAMARDYGPPRTDPAFMDLYNAVRRRLQTVLGTREDVLICTGEGMVVLWGVLKSLLKPGDTVLCV